MTYKHEYFKKKNTLKVRHELTLNHLAHICSKSAINTPEKMPEDTVLVPLLMTFTNIWADITTTFK